MTPLIEDIEFFCRTHGMSESTFGRLALKDWKFVRDLRGQGRKRPRRIWPETERTVRHFMATYKQKQAA
jgi:hypothetical protein